MILRFAAVVALYHCGDLLSRLLDTYLSDFPHDAPDWLIGWWYHSYSKLLWLSATLDVNEVIWVTPRGTSPETPRDLV